MKNILDYETVALVDDDDAIEIIDQTLLPGKTEMIRLDCGLWNISSYEAFRGLRL